MARIRTVKPEFWADEKIGTLSFLERLLFIGLWNYADDEGIFKASPLYLKGMIFPYDQVSTEEIEAALKNFKSLKMVFLYQNNGQQYGWVIKFRNYQRIDKPQPSPNPHPSIQNTEYATAIHERDKYICHLCGQITSPFQGANTRTFPTLDHQIPQSKGGNHYPSNLKTACSGCNKSRGNKVLAKKQHSKNIPGTFQECSTTEGSVVKGIKEKEIEEKTLHSAREAPPPSKFERPKTSTGNEVQETTLAKIKKLYPCPTGKFLDEQEVFRRLCLIPETEYPNLLRAVKHYADSERVKRGVGIKDPKNFLGNQVSERSYWKEWLEPEKPPDPKDDKRFNFLKQGSSP